MRKRLTLSDDKVIAGVCGGIAEYFGWSPSTVRILYAIATMSTSFSGCGIYFFLWIIMPKKSQYD